MCCLLGVSLSFIWLSSFWTNVLIWQKIFPAFDAAQFRFFAILGALTGVVQNTSLAFGVKPFEGPGGVLLKKVKDLSQEYEDGDSITFSAQVQGDFTSKA
mmetsp:Transcript_28159/g.65137  ORF Transcript_28159/g.65137 Transcript_28159/m.65137 type:complete len:100 (+) Transcript_28159:467-766(+)